MRQFLLALLLCFSLQVVAGQEATETPIARERSIESIFSNDTCAPPCWFGLVAGESAAQEAVDFLTSSEYVFEPMMFQHGELFPVLVGAEAIEDGRYNFSFRPVERTLSYGIYSYVLIREGLLDMIAIVVRENITLGEVIETMGWPDVIRLSKGYNPDDFYFTFIYYEPYIRLTIANGESRRRETLCNYFSTQDNFLVGGVAYYSPRSAMELVEIYVPNGEVAQYQPYFLAYQPEEKYVPPDLWPILMGDRAFLCKDLWELLSGEDVLPAGYENQ